MASEPDNLIDRGKITAPQHREDNVAAGLWVGGHIRVAHSLSSAAGGYAVCFGEGPEPGTRIVEMNAGRIELPAASTLLGGQPGRLALQDVLLDGEKSTGVARWNGSEISME